VYACTNFKTKKELKEAVASGRLVETYQPGGLFPAVRDGDATLEGPHYPQPHRWYARVRLKDGAVVKVLG